MTRTNKKVRYPPGGKGSDPTSAARGVEDALKILEGRWKLVILFHLFGGKVLRFSDLERAIPAISQKMLIQQLRQMEGDGIVRRVVHHQVPPKVEYGLTEWGQAVCPALDALLKWASLREVMSDPGEREPWGGRSGRSGLRRRRLTARLCLKGSSAWRASQDFQRDRRTPRAITAFDACSTVQPTRSPLRCQP